MRSFLTLKRVLAALLVVVLLALAVWAQQHRLVQRAWFNSNVWRDAAMQEANSIWLTDYRVKVEAQPIAGLEADISALTYDPDRRSLFTVTNQNPQLIELSLDGEVLRRIQLTGFGDPEAVEYISPNVFVITDEREHRLFKVQIDDAGTTTQLNAQDAAQLSLGIGLNGNKGFEGLAYDRAGKRLFVAKERDPMRIIEITGFAETAGQSGMSVNIADNLERDKGLFVRDLSSLQFDSRTRHLLALSDESRLIIELNAEGKPVSTLSLLAGRHGLQRSVPQAEGVAMDDHGVLYLISEPNLFYVFEKCTENTD